MPDTPLRVAIVLTGETRSWENDASTATPPMCIPDEYTKFNDEVGPTIDIDYYGITWDHCKLSKKLDMFKSVKKLNFETDYKNERMTGVLKKHRQRLIIDTMSTDDVVMYNYYAQAYMWFEGIKLAKSLGEYDWIIKFRWDMAPRLAMISSIYSLHNCDNEMPTLATCNPEIHYSSHYPLGDLKWSDYIFAVNRKLQDYIYTTPTEQIISNNIETSFCNTPSNDLSIGFFNYEFLPTEILRIIQAFRNSDRQLVMDKSIYDTWHSITDDMKNKRIIGRPPT
jgi:hypothetical protein